MSRDQPRYPIYIVSKGRAESRLTARMLAADGVSFRIVIEAQEYDSYAAVIDPTAILVLDPAYQDAYNPCDDLGRTKSLGSGPARNFVWDHAQLLGVPRYWILDDNIKGMFRFHRNLKTPAAAGVVFRAMEDFVDRYQNVALAGPNYFMFVTRKSGDIPPFVPNTRLYSCILIDTTLPIRWRARYNEDVDLSLRVLKAGYATIQFNAFLQYKMPTQTMRGGNTDELYAQGTAEKSAMIVRLHPDVARLAHRFGRDHHYVDYRRFRGNSFPRRDGIVIPAGIDNYGMVLTTAQENPT